MILIQNLLPECDLEQTAQILFEAACPMDNAVAIDPEVAEGILGSEASVYQTASASSAPPKMEQINEELKTTAAKLQARVAKITKPDEGYWQPPPSDAQWSKAAMENQMPSPDYKAHRGLQGTWEVSFQGRHLAKRSFQKFGSEDGAATQILWLAWCHHTRRTGQPCQLPWLLSRFDISETGDRLRSAAAEAAEATPLIQLGREPQPKRKRQVAATEAPAKKSRGRARAAASKLALQTEISAQDGQADEVPSQAPGQGNPARMSDNKLRTKAAAKTKATKLTKTDANKKKAEASATKKYHQEAEISQASDHSAGNSAVPRSAAPRSAAPSSAAASSSAAVSSHCSGGRAPCSPTESRSSKSSSSTTSSSSSSDSDS